MKGRWRPVRLIFVGLLLCLAGYLYAYWPVHQRWKVPNQYYTVLGFCPKGNVLLVAPVIANDTISRLYESAKDLSNRLAPQPDPDSFQMIGLNLDDGTEAFVHDIRHTGKPIPVTLSPDGQFLAFDERVLEKTRIINTLTGQLVTQLDNSSSLPGYRVRTFSHDGSLLGSVTASKVQVWNLQGAPRLREIEINNLELAQFKKLHRQELTPLQVSIQYFLSFSRDNRYLAFAENNVVTVFDASTLQIIGEAVSKGRPQFLADGTLAMIQTTNRALKPLAAHFRIEQGQLNRIMNDQQNDPIPHKEVAWTENAYATIQIVPPDWRLPAWTPDWLVTMTHERFSFMNSRWALSLRELTTGKELVQRRFQEQPDIHLGWGSDASGSFVPDDYIKSYVPFTSLITLSSDHRWIAMSDSDSIELWPLLTYWRPWYCWLTVIFIGCTSLFIIFSPRLFKPGAIYRW